MKTRKSPELASALEKKGFNRHQDKKHVMFFYVHNGKKSQVRTFLSHNGQEYGANLMSKIRKQMMFDSVEQAEDFFDCPMSAEDYRDILLKKGVI